MIGKVRSDLPAVAAAADTIATETHGAIVGALHALAGKTEGTAGDRSTRELKKVAEVYKETNRTLLWFSNVSEVTALAPLWGQLACKLHQGRTNHIHDSGVPASIPRAGLVS